MDDEQAEVLRLTLVTALVADLDAGFADVIRSCERLVYSVALRLGGRPVDAEDLAAESFLRAHRALRGYADARIRPWLLTIVRNTARNPALDASLRHGAAGRAGRRPA